MALWQYIFWGQAIYFDDALHGVSITVNQIFFTVRILFNKLFCKNEIPISDSRQVYWEGMILSNVDYLFLHFQNEKKNQRSAKVIMQSWQFIDIDDFDEVTSRTTESSYFLLFCFFFWLWKSHFKYVELTLT